jgi:hypothetical protein
LNERSIESLARLAARQLANQCQYAESLGCFHFDL